jgi:predicted acylesterase/phospholipase RssA
LWGKALALVSGRYADLAFDQGYYSSRKLRAWVEAQLTAQLPKEKHPITFASLPYPTYIVSADLSRSEAKIWSQRTTPNELVAEAVEASCAMPIFFQPVGRRYVDGGVLSNLPTFVFSDRQISDRVLASRVLAFTLKADDADPTQWGTEHFLQLLAAAIVDGGQSLQLDLQTNVTTIVIPTGKITATDFDRITPEAVTTLISNGATATLP